MQRVVELSKKYLPQMAVGFDNPKVKVHIQDGMEFMLQNKKAFDVVITDSSDPIGTQHMSVSCLSQVKGHTVKKTLHLVMRRPSIVASTQGDHYCNPKVVTCSYKGTRKL